MKIKQYSINQAGMNEIRAWLGKNHKKAIESGEGGGFFTDEMISAWAADAEFQLSEGNSARIEIVSYKSVNGCTQQFEVSDAGLDVEEIEIDE